jgi:hypothetical protein
MIDKAQLATPALCFKKKDITKKYQISALIKIM